MALTKRKKLKIYTAIAFVALLIGLVFFLFSDGEIEILKAVFTRGITKEEVRELLAKFGWKGYITLGILSMLQVVFAFLPAEPVQVISGLSFGLLKGSLICLSGVVLGNTLIYILYRIYGNKLTEYFQTNAEFDFDTARKSNKIALIIFILYFLPAIPYGMICLFSASLDIKYPKYIIWTTLGSIPSILIGVGLGELAIASGWIVSLAVFAVLVTLLVVLFKNRTKVFQKVNAFMKKRANAVHKPNPVALWFILFFVSFIHKTKVKFRLKNQAGKLPSPSIVLLSHGSFIDFSYCGKILRKYRPHVISARLYFYHKKLGKLLRYLGAIPKSMFATDIENVKSCVRVLNAGDMLAMMPEARLSTVGKYEGIQESTYKFIQRMAMPVYTVRFDGGYFANPKWGDGVRKGGVVEATLSPLFSADEVKTIPLEQLKQGIDNALAYDDFAWLETRPEIKYKRKTLAKGLENILYLCPHCGAKYSLTTDKCTLTCSRCGMQATLNNRYAFIDGKPFENFAKWYEWQTQETAKEIENDDYSLMSKVELRHGSTDGKSLTRKAGEGVCTLDRTGLIYRGTQDGKTIEKTFPMSQIYRLLFGAGEDFEIYEGKEIWFFVPEEKRSCVEWYVASGILKTRDEKEKTGGV
ncbi:MAG: VTT domain-containing protein [Clostridia bacterium]|nr:VTT domain-containing protein [Clostridia bacterium]